MRCFFFFVTEVTDWHKLTHCVTLTPNKQFDPFDLKILADQDLACDYQRLRRALEVSQARSIPIRRLCMIWLFVILADEVDLVKASET